MRLSNNFRAIAGLRSSARKAVGDGGGGQFLWIPKRGAGAKAAGQRDCAAPLVAEKAIRGYLAATVTAACSASLAALSVDSQVKSGSVRPKWP